MRAIVCHALSNFLEDHDHLMQKWFYLMAAGAVVAGCAFSAKTPFTFEQDETRLQLREDGRPVLVFNYGQRKPPADGIPREGYIHPLYAPDGGVLTDDFPADHPHHRGVFFAWPEMTILGRQVDGWHLKGIRPSFEAWGPRRLTPEAASFEVRNLWRLWNDADTATVREHLRYTVHAADDTGRVIDVHATFTNLTDEPVILRGKEPGAYGGFNVRIDGVRPDVRITTARGAVERNADFVDPPSLWADHSSRTAEGRPYSGVAIFQHPGNPDYPVRSWTLRPYGFLGAAWPGPNIRAIAPGGSLDLRYRLYIHRGDVEEAGVAERFERYMREATP